MALWGPFEFFFAGKVLFIFQKIAPVLGPIFLGASVSFLYHFSSFFDMGIGIGFLGYLGPFWVFGGDGGFFFPKPLGI